MTHAIREIEDKGQANDRNNHSDSQKLVLHSASGGSDGDILPRERDGGADGVGGDVQLHSKDGSGQVSSGSAGRNSCSQTGDPLHFLNTLPRKQVAPLVSGEYEARMFREVIGSPEPPSDADAFANEYCERNGLPRSMEIHLAIAWVAGGIATAKELQRSFCESFAKSRGAK